MVATTMMDAERIGVVVERKRRASADERWAGE
jgi:hypothetical protein